MCPWSSVAPGSIDVLTLVFEKKADVALSHCAGTISTGGVTLTILP